MASTFAGFQDKTLAQEIDNAKLLVVGAGGIGCELLKNLVLTGFADITLIDLDTIDVSNLNRQFLFQKKHVGKSKAEVARETALKFNPNAKIIANHDNITSPAYDIQFFKSFSIVLNALDNRAARNHVNRMCLAANVPLVESGTAGYFGQVSVIKKSITECYECQPKTTQKTFPGCTIRNTPSEPIHCIVWSKHLFNQLFGEADPDEDVSPDTADPEAAGDAGLNAENTRQTNSGNVERVSTRSWAINSDYKPSKLFRKLFHDDIKYLLSMDKLWQTRRKPTPLDLENIPENASTNGNSNVGMDDLRVWPIKECVNNFCQSVLELKKRLYSLSDGDHLVWDKDDFSSMNFVAACANIRAYIFGISQKNRFDIKSMAGNIIPAIATTNAIISGLIVLEAIKVLQGKLNLCKTVYLNRQPNYRKKLLVPCELEKPNPKCYVCSDKPEVTIRFNTKEMTIKMFEDKILKNGLNMVAPDVEIDDGKGTILISSEEGETIENNDKKLSEFGIKNSSRLKCDDFLQVLEININVIHCEECEDGKDFEIIGDVSELKAKSEALLKNNQDNLASSSNISEGTSKDILNVEDDLMIIDEQTLVNEPPRKRKRSKNDDTPVKKKISRNAEEVHVETIS